MNIEVNRIRCPLVFLGCILLCAAGAAAQVGPRSGARDGREMVMPWTDPEAMLNAFFGPASEEEQTRLERIPISAREEQTFGQRTWDAFLSQLNRQGVAVTRRGADIDYLRALVETLRPQMQNPARYRRIQIVIVESSGTDARCFPGGFIAVFRGLLDYVENEAALIGVLGHELSHLDRGHQLVHLKTVKAAQQTFSDREGIVPEDFFATGTAMMRVFMRPYRPEEELEADLDGARWAYEAGYDCRELAQLFLRWQQRDRQQRHEFASFWRSHPYHEDRYRAVMELYDELQREDPQDGLAIGRENLRTRTPLSSRE